MQRTQIYFSKNQLRLLKKIACEKEISLSEIVRNLTKEFLAEEAFGLRKGKKRVNAGDWLLSLAREAESLKIEGPKDLSLTIDKNLY